MMTQEELHTVNKAATDVIEAYLSRFEKDPTLIKECSITIALEVAMNIGKGGSKDFLAGLALIGWAVLENEISKRGLEKETT